MSKDKEVFIEGKQCFELPPSRVKLVGSRGPAKTKLLVNGVPLAGVESINVTYTPNEPPKAVVTFTDFDIEHKGGKGDR